MNFWWWTKLSFETCRVVQNCRIYTYGICVLLVCLYDKRKENSGYHKVTLIVWLAQELLPSRKRFLKVQATEQLQDPSACLWRKSSYYTLKRYLCGPEGQCGRFDWKETSCPYRGIKHSSSIIHSDWAFSLLMVIQT